MMQSFLFEPRKVQATEARLKAIFEAARLGLRGDTLALAAGMMPSEYRQLCQMDPVAEMAEAQGRAYSEMQAATIVDKAIAEGDAKMALDKLKHRHDWQAAQRVQIDVTQQISIVDALAQAEQRVIEGCIIDETRQRTNSNGLLINDHEKDGHDYKDFNSRTVKRVT